MKKIMLFVACLGLFAPAYAQFNAILMSLTPVHFNCDSACDPIGNEYFADIYWDQNMNGPDPDDVQPIVGDDFAQCNFNTISMATGEQYLGIPGTFATDPAFTISTTTPQPSRYYIKIEAQGTIWVSSVFIIPDGLNDIVVEGWTCNSNALPPQQDVYILLDPTEWYLNSFCLPMLLGLPVQICYSPVQEYFLPLVSLTPGCSDYVIHCSNCAEPDNFFFDPDGWQYDPVNQSLCNWIIPEGIGCVHYDEDSHIPVQFGSFTAEARDRSILLTWTTHSERSIQNFVVRRDGIEIYTADPANTAVGETYTYLDEGLENGRAYTYTIDVVNMDGSVQAWPTSASASPSGIRSVVNEYALHQNYPNPFNATTNFAFDVVRENHVELSIFNVTGELVARPIKAEMPAGRHAVSFDASTLATGLYFYTLAIGNEFTATKKMLLLK